MARYAKFFSVGGGGGGTNNLQLPVGTVLDTTLRQVQDGLGTGSPLYISTLRLGITSDTSVTTQTSSVIQATTTNANLVIAPNGTGALIADIPDSTPTGGNARGDNAVDLQTYRAGAPEVASGDISVIGGGRGNTASNNYSVVSGGYSNISSGQFSYVGAGTSNTASSNYSTVSGGQSNTASTNTHATVVGGQSNTSSGQHSVSGGQNNVASGNEASVALGIGNTASGARSVAIGALCTASGLNATCFGRQNQASGGSSFIGGGEANQATADYSAAFGLHALANQFGAITNANGIFQYKGDAQVVNLLARKQDSLTTGATTKLSLDGTGTTNLIDFGLSGSYAFSFLVTIKWSAGINNANGAAGISNDDCITQTDQIMMKKLRYGALSLVGTTSTLVTKGDASMTTSAMNYSVSGTSELVLNYQAPTFASGGPITVRVLASIEVVSLTTAPF